MDPLIFGFDDEVGHWRPVEARAPSADSRIGGERVYGVVADQWLEVVQRLLSSRDLIRREHVVAGLGGAISRKFGIAAWLLGRAGLVVARAAVVLGPDIQTSPPIPG